MPVAKMPLADVKEICREFLSRVSTEADDFRKKFPQKGEFTAWTLAVKSVLAQMGDKRGFDSLYSNREKDLHEFLLDFVWWKREADEESAVLACESEFGNNRDELGNPKRVAEDFDKLLSFKAPLKLMIFDSYGGKARITTTVKEVIELLNYRLRKFNLHIAGETYVLLDTCENPKLWTCEIPADGRNTHLSFSEFDISI